MTETTKPEKVSYKQTLNLPVFYGIPESPSFLASINKGRPLVADRQFAPETDKWIRAFVDKATKPQGAGAEAMAKSA